MYCCKNYQPSIITGNYTPSRETAVDVCQQCGTIHVVIKENGVRLETSFKVFSPETIKFIQIPSNQVELELANEKNKNLKF